MTDAPHIWTRRPQILEPRRELILSCGSLAAMWQLNAIRPDGRVRPLTGWFPNLITDAGLDRPPAATNWWNQCVVGSDNTAPQVSDTALGAQIASTQSRIESVYGNNVGGDRYSFARITWRFALGVAAGVLAEIGVRQDSGNVFSRARILDGGGSPATIEVLANEVLDATYEIRNYPPLADVEDTILINSDPYNIVLRAAALGTAGGWKMSNSTANGAGWTAGLATSSARLYPSTSVIGAITALPSGTPSAASTGSNATYTPGLYYRDHQRIWNMDAGNVSGGAAACDNTCGAAGSVAGESSHSLRYQMSFDPPIPKNASNILSLQFRQSWFRRTL